MISTYLNLLSNDVHEAFNIASKIGLKYISIGYIFDKNIANLPDDIHQQILAASIQHKIRVISLHASMGNVSVDKLPNEHNKVKRLNDIAKYYSCKYVQLGIGRHVSNDSMHHYVYNWMQYVKENLTATPIFKIDYADYLSSAAEVGIILKFGWEIQYDPSLLLRHKNVDPFVRYWIPLNSKIVAIDIDDWKPGVGPQAIGSGDCKVNDIISPDKLLIYAQTLNSKESYGFQENLKVFNNYGRLS